MEQGSLELAAALLGEGPQPPPVLAVTWFRVTMLSAVRGAVAR